MSLESENLKKQRYNVGKIYLSRISKQLDEVTVTATKVKFYNRGDTIVFNADAFVTSEGSMIDALIRQLPGVELHSDGRIYVNGRFVDNLMLNGKDFFKNNRQVMLDNIGAYTVKNIEVYDKLSDRDKFAGGAPTEDRELVMDVKLKKEYMDNWIVNLMGGYGTSERYLGRAFAMRFTPRSSIALYANANNTNESRKPGEGVYDWSPQSISTGTQEVINGGLNYSWDSYDHVWKLKGNLDVNYSDAKDGTSINRTNFLKDGFTYDYSDNRIRQKNLTLWAYQEVSMEKGQIRWWAAPRWYYKKWDSSAEDVSASFRDELAEWSAEFLKTIYEKGESATKTIINRNISGDTWQGHYTNGGVHGGATYMIPGTFKNIDLNFQIMGDGMHENHFNDYKLQFGDKGNIGSESHRRFENYPTNGWNMDARLSYNFSLGKGFSMSIQYIYNHDRHKNTSMLYAMTKEYAATSVLLPSLTEIGNQVYSSIDNAENKLTLDKGNSYCSINRNDEHTIMPTFRYYNKNLNLTIQLPIPVTIATDKLEYSRGGTDINKSRTTWVMNNKWSNPYLDWNFGRFHLFMTAQYYRTTPSLLYMIDITDTSDPLVINKGNEDLKEQSRVAGSYNLRYSNSPANISSSLGGAFETTHNAVARGMSYDYATGVKTYRYYNVDGNRNWSIYNVTHWSFGPRKSINLSNKIEGSFAQSVDVMGNGQTTYLSKVRKSGINDLLTLGWQWSGQRINLVGNVNYSHFTGSEADFTPFNALEFNYGINTVFKLPANFGISTDFMIYSRRGYSDETLNTNNFVWNGRITYSMLKGNLIAAIDGYDILHNLSNVFYSVNAQGRTETYRTVLPRYIMLSLQWRFSTLNKK